MARGKARAGYTLLETVVALAIFSVLGYTIASGVQMAHRSHDAVMEAVAENRARREAWGEVVEELASANSASIQVTSVAGVNDVLEFQMPIMIGGNAEWGISEPALGLTEALQNRAGWKIRFTVVDVPLGAGEVNRTLFRQVVDDKDVVQHQEAVADGLRSGVANPMGFAVDAVGDVWQVTLTTEGNATDSEGRSSVFHVQTRN